MKRCTKCDEVKSLEEFHRNRQSGDGRCSSCKACVSKEKRAYYEANCERERERKRAYNEGNREVLAERARSYRKTNREALADSARAYRKANQERSRKQRHAYREANREAIAERNRTYREANKEPLSAYLRTYREANRETISENGRAWREANSEKVRIYHQRRRARLTAATVERFTYDELLKHYAAMGYDGCAYCDGPHEHDDHIVPLSRGGAHSRENLAPACSSCNLSKGSKILAEWLGFTT